jgi:hypothetical protein
VALAVNSTNNVNRNSHPSAATGRIIVVVFSLIAGFVDCLQDYGCRHSRGRCISSLPDAVVKKSKRMKNHQKMSEPSKEE